MRYLKAKKFFNLAFMLLSVLVLIGSEQAAAITQNDIDCAKNSNCFFESCPNPAAGDAGAPIQVGSEVPDNQLPGNSRRQKIWNYLIAQGWTTVQAAGIMGNIAVEGVWDPENIEDPATRTKDPNRLRQLTGQTQGYGLVGFTPGASLLTNSPIDWGISGVKVTDDNFYYISTQLDVVYGFMKNYQGWLQQYQNQVTDSTSPGDAALAFENIFENPAVAVSHDSRREAAANDAMQDFGNGGGGANIGGGVSDGGGGGGVCCGVGGAPTGPSDAVGAGDLQSLAQRVLNSDNITYDYGPNGPTATQFKRLANGQKAETDDGRQVDVQPILLVALLHLAQTHKVTVSALTNGQSHLATDNPHGMGKAIDIDYLDGAGTDGSDSVANKIISDLEQVLPSGSNFGMGNHPFGDKTVNGKTFHSFPDNPSHVHYDVVGVSQANDDKAVVDASNGGDTSADANGPSVNGGGMCCPGGGGASFGPGTLPPSVPDPYNGIFTAAAAKFDVSPAFLAAVFYGGEHGNSFPDPPPPYGHGSPWATSYAGANGPFQFLTSTWAGYAQDGNGDGKKDIQDLTDAAFGAAKYLADLGAKGTTDEGKLRQAAADYNGIHDPSASYPSLVWAAFQKFGGVSGGSIGGGGGDAAVTAAGGCSVLNTGSPDCTKATGNTKILCEAKQYNGIYYLSGGGHGTYASFRSKCPLTNLATAASSSTPGDPGPCATDCSGLVDVATGAAFGIDMGGPDVAGIEKSHFWKEISIGDVRAGDIVTQDPNVHVEIVDHSSGGTIYTFGSHAPGEKTGPQSWKPSDWSAAYRYVGPGAS